MKSSFNFKIANVSVPMVEANIGEISIAAEVEYTPEEFLTLVSQAGTFYKWLGEKAEPIIALGIAQVIAKMEREAMAEEAEAREYAEAANLAARYPD